MAEASPPHPAIYQKLISVAKRRATLSYSEVAPLAGLDMANADDRTKISTILGEISAYEHRHHRPLLSAVVVHKDNDVPGEGFFTLARVLEVYRGEDDLVFFVQELQEVYDHWAR